ncbi:MAG TPA: hypothetical protein PK467_14300, partial [Candidatus Wallbacteria bacterium]|nr:hypothetical protein [Candidatus Wallbacteria bacterium]
ECFEFEGYSAVLDGADSANNQKYADVISVLAPAKLILNYQDASGKAGAAIAVKTEVYRLVYMGFGFEGIAGEASRCDFMKRAVKFLMPDQNVKIVSLAAAENRLALSKNESELLSTAGLECEKIITDVKKLKYERLNGFIAGFEKAPGAQIYKIMGAGLRSGLIHEVNAENSKVLTPAIEKISSLLK